MIRATTCLVAACFGLVLLSGPGWGHGEEATTDPADGATLRRAPGEIVVTLTEAPSDNVRVIVTDGCREDVTGEVTVSGNDIVVHPAEAHAGRWRVAWSAISEVDGHETEGRFSFRVRGARDCAGESEETTPPPGSPSPGATSDRPSRAIDDDGSFPVVPVVLGAAAVVGLAAAARVAGGRRRRHPRG